MASYPFCDWPHTWYHDNHLASQNTKARHDNSPNSEGFLSDAQIRNTIFKSHAFCLDCVVAVMIWGEKGTRWCSLMSLLSVLLTAHNLPLLDLSLSPAFPPLLPSPHPIPFLFSLPFSLLSHLVLLLSSPPFPLPPSLPLPSLLSPFCPPLLFLYLPFLCFTSCLCASVIWTEVCGSCCSYPSLSSLVSLFWTHRPFLTQHIN